MNPAARILRVLEHFNASNSSTACVDLWRQYLIDNGPSTTVTSKEVYGVVLVFLEEVEQVKDRLLELKLPNVLFDAAIVNVENAFQLPQLPTTWAQLRGNLPAEVMMAWRWCAWHMDVTESPEDELNAEALQRLAEQLHSLQDVQNDPDLPSGLRKALERQIESLQRALQLYALIGASALEEAYLQTSGVLLNVDISDEDLNHRNKETVEKMMAAFRATAGAIGKGAVWVKEGTETVTFFSEGLKKLIGLAG